MLVPFIGFIGLYVTWWLRELFWPALGPPLAPDARAPLAVGSIAAIIAGTALPVVGAVQRRRNPGERVFSRWSWALPLAQVIIWALLIWITVVQKEVYVKRLQIVADVRAGGENRGAVLLPWNYRLFPGAELAAGASFPVVALTLFIASQLGTFSCSSSPLIQYLLLACPGALLMCVFWWFVGKVLDGSFRPKGAVLRRVLADVGVAVGILATIFALWMIRSYWQKFPIACLGTLAWGLVLLSISVRTGVIEMRKRRKARETGP
jgi:hypothetical protein